MKELFIDEINRNAQHITFDTIDEHKYIDDDYNYSKLNADTVYRAWLNAENMLVASRIIKSNTERFSDEKISAKNLE